LFGFVPNLGLAMALEPAALDTYLAMLQGIGQTSLTPVEQQVVMVAASRANEASYGIAVHSTLAAKLGAGPAVVNALRHGNALPDAKLEALREFASEFTVGRTQVSDAVLARFTAAGYGAPAGIAVAMAVAAKTFANGVAHLARPEIDAGFRG
jgi:AhpD family alkylhydroperoxidase